METRQITEVKIWRLILNPMRSNTEDRQLLAISDDREKLLNWYKNEFASEPYYSVGENSFPAKGDFPAQYSEHHKYYKVFKLGSILEWMNPLMNEDEMGTFGHGIDHEWLSEDVVQNGLDSSIYFVH